MARAWGRGLAAGLVVSTGAFAACTTGYSPVDRSGGETVLLRFATIDGEIDPTGQYYAGQAFIDQLAKVSDGRIRVRVTTSYGSGRADAEAGLVHAIASGHLDGGWPSTRAFAAAGIPGLAAVEAPMALTSRDAVDALVTGTGADLVLGALGGTGLRGLALTGGPLRRPFATSAPLLGPSDWSSVRFRTYHSEVEAAAIRALGAAPVDVGTLWPDLVRAGNLDGVDLDIGQYAAGGYSDQAPYATSNVVLWPKLPVLTLSQERFDSLTNEQQGWVLEAARAAMKASITGSFDDDETVRGLCDSGASFRPATRHQLSQLHKAASTVWTQLDDQPAEAALMRQVRSIAARFPHPDIPDVPNGCGKPPRPASELVSHQPSDIPGGVYRAEIPTSVVENAGVSDGPGFSGTWTLRIREGTYALYCRPLGAPGNDCGNVLQKGDGPYEAGLLRGQGHSVAFVSNPKLLASLTGCELPASLEDGHCQTLATYAATWTLHDGALTFGDITGGEGTYLMLQPWRRIGS